MKKIILFFTLSVVFATTTWSQTSNLVVFSEDLNPFYLVVNGIKQNATAQTNVKVTDLKTTDNAVMVIFEDKALGTVKQNIYFTDMGVEVTAKITKTSKGYKLRHFDEVPLEEATPSTNQYSTSFQNVNVENSVSDDEPIPVKSSAVETPLSIGTTPVESTTPKIVSSSSSASTGSSLNMRYKWLAGKKYTFVVNQTDNVSTSIMGMSMKDQFKGTTKFLMAINTVDTKGNASGTLYLLDYKVVDSKGSVLASLANLPATAIKSDFKVDTKGNFTFVKKITLVTTEQGNALVYANTTDSSISVGGQAENVNVNVYAEFDPKTGALKAGYTIKEAQPVKQITIKVDENTDEVDVLPYDYLSLLALPEGEVRQGDSFKVTTGIYTIDILAKNISNGVAQLNYKMGTDKTKSIAGSSATAQSQNASMSMEMPNMDQMMSEIGDEDKRDMELTKQLMPTMAMDFDSFFDANTGMFSAIKGVLTTSYNAMGFKMEVVSNLEMKKL